MLRVGVAVEFEAFIEFLQFHRSTMEEMEFEFLELLLFLE
jgi:hypothetical protein